MAACIEARTHMYMQGYVIACVNAFVCRRGYQYQINLCLKVPFHISPFLYTSSLLVCLFLLFPLLISSLTMYSLFSHPLPLLFLPSPLSASLIHFCNKKIMTKLYYYRINIISRGERIIYNSKNGIIIHFILFYYFHVSSLLYSSSPFSYPLPHLLLYHALLISGRL